MAELSVAIGGVGGSGTRVVSQILRNCGWYVGNELNRALDNLWFTLLLRQPAWSKQFPSEQEIQFALGIFKQLMEQGSLEPLDQQQIEYIKARPLSPHYTDEEKVRWTLIVDGIFNGRSLIKSPDKLAWKEPNTHIFLPQIATQFPTLRYVHIIRNGYYMARSRNQRQVKAWHKHFDIEVSNPITPEVSLEYWLRANKRAITTGKKMLGERFYLLDFDELCSNPLVEVKKLLEALNIETDAKTLASICEEIKVQVLPELDVSAFSGAQIERVGRLGYSQPADAA